MDTGAYDKFEFGQHTSIDDVAPTIQENLPSCEFPTGLRKLLAVLSHRWTLFGQFSRSTPICAASIVPHSANGRSFFMPQCSNIRSIGI
jgi:hypothetical protein